MGGAVARPNAAYRWYVVILYVDGEQLTRRRAMINLIRVSS
jgi:hypothetical protein